MIILCAYFHALSPELVKSLLLLVRRDGFDLSNAEWRVPPAQLHQLHSMAVISSVAIPAEVGGESQKRYGHSPCTMGGVKVTPDDKANPHFVDLVIDGKEIARIEALAIPIGF
jgi:hypothetical protein